MKIFRPNGNELVFDENKFVKYYRNDYFLNNEEYHITEVINHSSEFIEREIETILHNGIKQKRDVARILAWKIGFIDHEKSTSGFVYKEYWSEVENKAEQIDGFVRGSIISKKEDFPIGRIAEYIVNDPDNLKKSALSNNPREFLTKFKNKEKRKEGFKGLGTVYILTLLYFLSNEKFPIYDRFAHKAAKAIVLDKTPKDVYVGSAPDKTDVENILNMYNEYLCLLKLIFGNKKIDRKQDQALWVYGHSKVKYPAVDENN